MARCDSKVGLDCGTGGEDGMIQKITVSESGYIKVENKTIQYYNENAKEFCEGTLHADMSQGWVRAGGLVAMRGLRLRRK